LVLKLWINHHKTTEKIMELPMVLAELLSLHKTQQTDCSDF